MKRQTALAVCLSAACFHANLYAQSSVTLQGMVDGGVTWVNNEHGGSVTQFDSGIFAPNVLTFSASEDLGGGTKALFNLTSQFDLGSGATIPGAGQIFNRTAYVGLSDERLGTVTLGNQYDFMFETLTLGLFDGAFLFGGLYDFRQGPFSALGIPQNPTGSFDFDRLAGATRVANAVKYRSVFLRIQLWRAVWLWRHCGFVFRQFDDQRGDELRERAVCGRGRLYRSPIS